MQAITVIGNMGKDPEKTTTARGAECAKFSVAGNNGKDRQPTWYYVAAFGKNAEYALKHLHKGDRVAVCGRLEASEKDGKTWLNVTADSLEGFPRMKTVRDDGVAGEDYDPFE